MVNAARAVEREVLRLRPRSVLIVCGPGNNGGDGIVLASLLSSQTEARVLLSHPRDQIRQPEARWALSQIDAARVPVEVFAQASRFRELAARSDMVVDALLGSGTKGPLRRPIRSLVQLINASKKPVVSIDVPTGYEGDLGVRPSVTVALHAKKPGMVRENSGRIVVADIGIPREAAQQVGPADFFVAYPRNKKDSHKGKNGRLLIIAGGPYTGAPMLCAAAALRTGIDLVRLYTPHDAARAAQARFPDLIVHPGTQAERLVRADVPRIRPLLRKVDAVLVGPGVGEGDETRQAVAQVLSESAAARVRVVLDADAIAVAAKSPELVRRLRPVLTPHRGEFRELTSKSVPAALPQATRLVEAQARSLRSCLLVKGPVDIISDGRRTKSNDFHHPAMTTGGTGDVLAGIVAGFVAKGMDPFRAACAAAFVNGDAGRRAADRQGGSLLATDLVRELPRVFRAWLG